MWEWILRCLAADWLFACVAVIAHRLGTLLLPGAGIALRWTAGGSLTLWLLTVLGHVLLAADRFTLVAALPVVSLAAGVLMMVGATSGRASPGLRDDLRTAAETTTGILRAGWRGFWTAAAWVALAAIAARGLLVPVVAWDSLTYHAFKAGLWVQGGGWEEWTAPGGWSIYRTYLGGGELLQAWGFLPFHGDLLAAASDVGCWALLGVAVHALGGIWGLDRSDRAVVSCYVLLIPAVSRAVGSLYVDLPLAALLVASLTLALRAASRTEPRVAGAALAVLGVAAGIKPFALPVIAAAAPTLLLLGVRSAVALRWVAWTAVGSGAALVAALPWFARNIRLTGLPLSPLPVRVLGVELGRANEALLWYRDRPDLAGTAREEVEAVGQLFGVPGLTPLAEPTLGVVSLLVAALGLMALLRAPRARLAKAVLMAAYGLPSILAFYGPGLRDTRLIWAPTSGRYLLGPLAILAVLSLSPGFLAAWRPVYRRLLGTGAALFVVGSVLPGWTTAEAVGACATALLAVGLTALAARYGRSNLPRALGLAAAIALPVAAMTALEGYRRATRPVALARSEVLHQSPRYWVPAALAVDAPDRAHRVAVTAGPAQDADNWFLYPFLGSRLQNELVYVPPTRNGLLIDLARYRDLVAGSDFETWLRRIADRRAEFVISFRPTSLELVWMERSAGRFRRVAGDGRSWGLYRVLDAAPR